MSNKKNKKIFHFSEIRKIASNNKTNNFVLCHGHFDLIHPGHLRFLEASSNFGGDLIVALYSDDFYLKSDKKNHFEASERAKNIASLETVKYVVIIHPNELHLLLDKLSISAFVMGEEFKKERKKEIHRTIKIAKKKKIKIFYHAGGQGSLEKNFKISQSEIRYKRWKQFHNVLTKEKININKFASKFKKINKKKLVIVGDIIIDQYINCHPLGMSEEAPLVVVKELKKNKFIGGAGIVALHLKKMSSNPYLISLTGRDQYHRFLVSSLNKLKINNFIITDPKRPTTLKSRYIVENQKMFRVSRLDDKEIVDEHEELIIDQLYKASKNSTAVIVSDFVYGVITEKIMDAIYKIKKKNKVLLIGDLQCSSQIGNAAKFKNFDLVCSTEKEARIAMQDNTSGIERIANQFIKTTNIKNFILKLGSDGFISYQNKKNTIKRIHFPALEPNPIDQAGAGDTLLATVAISLSAGFDFGEASALAACASSVAVQKMGNVPISLSDLDNFIKSNE